MAATALPELEAAILAAVDAGQLNDSADFAAAHHVDHQVVVGLLKSLLSADMITTQARARQTGLGGAGQPCRQSTPSAATPRRRPSVACPTGH